MSQSEQPTVTFEDLVATNQQLTKEILQGDAAMPVLRQMHTSLLHQLLNTHHFTAPVGLRMEEIVPLLDDGPAFRNSFRTFLTDIYRFNEVLKATRAQLDNISNPSAPESYPVLYSIADTYSRLMTEYDTVLHPMHKTLYDIVANQAPHLLVEHVTTPQKGQ